MSFNPNSVTQPKRLKRVSRKRVQFARRLVQHEWPRPTITDEHLLFHSQDDEEYARKAKDTCRDYRQYKIEEGQSFLDRAHTQLRYHIAQRTKVAPFLATEIPAAQRVSNRPTAQSDPQRVSNRPFAEKVTEARRTLTDIVRRAMDDAENSRYDDSYSTNAYYSHNDDSYSTDDYSVSENGMPKLRRRDDSSSDNTNDDDSLSPDGNESEYHSDDSYVDELSYSDDGRDQMPDLYINRYNDSSVDANSSFDDETVSTGGYDYESASDNELYDEEDKSFTDNSYDDKLSYDDKRFGDNSGWAREESAQDREAARVRKDREQRIHSEIIQDIYICKKHGRERRTYYTTPAPVRSRTPSLTSSP